MLVMVLAILFFLNRRQVANTTEHQLRMDAITAQISNLNAEEQQLLEKVLIVKTLHWFQRQSFSELGFKIFVMQRHLFDRISDKT